MAHIKIETEVEDNPIVWTDMLYPCSGSDFVIYFYLMEHDTLLLNILHDYVMCQLVLSQN